MNDLATVDMFRSLLRIVSDGRPRCPDGQYFPLHIVNQTRMQILEEIFAPYHIVKIEPCLHPQTGEQLPGEYLATFPDFEAWHVATSSWNSVQLVENPYISMVVMEDIDEDKKLAALLQCFDDGSSDLQHHEPMTRQPPRPATIFENWWSEEDPSHWVQHLERISHGRENSEMGVWLYINNPGDAQYCSDPTTFSYQTPATIEYKCLGRKEQEVELVTIIDWTATRMMERLAFVPPEYLSQPLILHTAWREESTSTSTSGTEDVDGSQARSDTPDSTPPASPRFEPRAIRDARKHSHTEGYAPEYGQLVPQPSSPADMSLQSYQATLVRDISPISALAKFEAALAKRRATSAGTTGQNLPVSEDNNLDAESSSSPERPNNLTFTFVAEPELFTPSSVASPAPDPTASVHNVSYQYPHFFVSDEPVCEVDTDDASVSLRKKPII
jgi:hypothetical protein